MPMVREPAVSFGDEGSTTGKQEDLNPAKGQHGKLHETEVISLLRTLYLKSGQPNPDEEDDAGVRQGGASRAGSKPRQTNRHTSSHSVSSKKTKGTLFGRSPSVAPETTSRSLSGKSSQHRNRRGMGIFGRNKWGRRDYDDGNSKPSKVHLENGDDFEYLNDSYPQYGAQGPHGSPPLGLYDTSAQNHRYNHRMPRTPEEEYYARQNGMMSSRSVDPRARGMVSPSRPTQQELRNRPGFVRGEAILQAEPVEAITSNASVQRSLLPSASHYTVTGQPVGQGPHSTPVNPIVAASGFQGAIGGANGSGRTPTVSNVNYEPPQMAPRGRDASTMKHPRSTASVHACASLPGQIVLDRRANRLEYSNRAGGEANTLVSDFSVSEGRKDPWNRSPNSVMSQLMKDLEPRNQCCIRGSTWYDALHYSCTRLFCDGRERKTAPKDGRQKTAGGYPSDDTNGVLTIDPRTLNKDTRRALDRILAEQHIV